MRGPAARPPSVSGAAPVQGRPTKPVPPRDRALPCDLRPLPTGGVCPSASVGASDSVLTSKEPARSPMGPGITRRRGRSPGSENMAMRWPSRLPALCAALRSPGGHGAALGWRRDRGVPRGGRKMTTCLGDPRGNRWPLGGHTVPQSQCPRGLLFSSQTHPGRTHHPGGGPGLPQALDSPPATRLGSPGQDWPSLPDKGRRRHLVSDLGSAGTAVAS